MNKNAGRKKYSKKDHMMIIVLVLLMDQIYTIQFYNRSYMDKISLNTR